jgi:4a-hydroxytetrahydrobiopterin dehydratase
MSPAWFATAYPLPSRPLTTTVDGMAELLSAGDVATAIGELEDWTGDTSAISRTAALPTFPAAIDVVDRVALVAEEMDHHPDMDIRWRTVTFICSTHSAGGVTDMDVTLAKRIDMIVAAAQ